MIDSFIGGVLTLAVLFFLMACVVLAIEAVPLIGAGLLVLFVVLVITTLISFTNRK